MLTRAAPRGARSEWCASCIMARGAAALIRIRCSPPPAMSCALPDTNTSTYYIPPAPAFTQSLEFLFLSEASLSPPDPAPLPAEFGASSAASEPSASSVPQTPLPPSEAPNSEAKRQSQPLLWMKITPDSLRPSRLLVHSSAGSLYVAHTPWLSRWDDYLHAGPPTSSDASPPPPVPPRSFRATLLVPKPSELPGVEPLPTCSRQSKLDAARRGRTAGVVGVVTLYDPCLGESLFVMSNAGPRAATTRGTYPVVAPGARPPPSRLHPASPRTRPPTSQQAIVMRPQPEILRSPATATLTFAATLRRALL